MGPSSSPHPQPFSQREKGERQSLSPTRLWTLDSGLWTHSSLITKLPARLSQAGRGLRDQVQRIIDAFGVSLRHLMTGVLQLNQLRLGDRSLQTISIVFRGNDLVVIAGDHNHRNSNVMIVLADPPQVLVQTPFVFENC